MKPRFLLIGFGKFGKDHLEVLCQLNQEKRIVLAGVVTRRLEIQNLLTAKDIPTHARITPSLLRSVDAVIIVTPVSTHYTLAKKCLPYTHVFVEKPLAMTMQEGKRLIEEARRRKKILAVGHIFRFNHAVGQLKKIIRPEKERLYYIEGRFTGGSGEPAQDCGVVTSDMHLVDVLDYIFGVVPSAVYCRGWTRIKGSLHEDQASLILDYPENIHAYLKLGWIKAEKIRSLVFYFPEKEISADLLAQTITTREYGKKEKILRCFRKQPLRMELEGFLAALKGRSSNYVTGEIANRIVGILERLRTSMRKKAVIYV